MAIEPAICIECGAGVPPGRFSCPECGALRASVRGRVDGALAIATAPAESDQDESALAVAAPDESAQAVAAPDEPASAVQPTPSTPALRPVAGGYVAAFAAESPSTTAVPAPAVFQPVPAVFPPAPAVFPPASSSPSPYVFPPVASAETIAPTSLDVPTPAIPPAAPPAQPVQAMPPLALLVTDQPFETPYDASGWLVRGGSIAATLSFVLPWAASSVGVVGTGAIGYGYFDRWSLANAWYLLPMLLALTVLGLSVVPNRLLLWVRNGVLPLIAGALYLGIAFVYIGSPFGGGPGVAILAAASLALGLGGVLGLRPGRHDGPPPIV